MALSKKNEMTRDIHMMLRKGYVMFEPGDRVEISGLQRRTTAGEMVKYFVGGIAYHPDYGNMHYFMFNDRGEYIVPEKGPRWLDTLPTVNLETLCEKVKEYCDKAMCRASNLAKILEVVEATEDKTIWFNRNSGFPSALVDLPANGELEQAMFSDLFKGEDGNLYLTSCKNGNEIFNYPLHSLTDMGVANVLSCIPENLKIEHLIQKEMIDPFDYTDKVCSQAEDVHFTVILSNKVTSSDINQLEMFLRLNGHAHCVLNINEDFSWKSANAIAEKIDRKVSILPDYGSKMDFQIVGDTLDKFPTGTTQESIDAFIGKVLTCLDVVMDWDVRRVVGIRGLDGICGATDLASIQLFDRNTALNSKAFSRDRISAFNEIVDSYVSISKASSIREKLSEIINKESQALKVKKSGSNSIKM